MPRVADAIFPYGVDAVSVAFTRACKALVSPIFTSTIRVRRRVAAFRDGRVSPASRRSRVIVMVIARAVHAPASNGREVRRWPWLARSRRNAAISPIVHGERSQMTPLVEKARQFATGAHGATGQKRNAIPRQPRSYWR